MPITASKYINNSDLKTSYIGLFNYKREARGKKDSEVDMYGLLFVSSKVEIPGDKLTKFAWDGVVDGFEYSKTDSRNESLKLGLTEATRRVKQLIVNDPEIGAHGVEVDFTVFVSNNSGLYIGLLGESDIYVYKGGRLVDIYDMLMNKRAKTAAVAIEDGDIVFCSTKGFLKDNIQKLISTKNREELIAVLEELGKEVGNDTGLVVFTKCKDEILTRVEEIKKVGNIEKKHKLIKEPLDTDYISENKLTKKIFKTPGEDRDLKEVISKILKRFSFVKIGLTRAYTSITPAIKKAGGKIGGSFRNLYSKSREGVSSRFGKKRWFKKVSATVSQSNLGKRDNKKFESFKIDGYKQRGTRLHRFKILFFVFLGIALVVGGIKFTLDQKEAREISKSANEIFSSVEKLVKDAQSKIGTDRNSTETYIFEASEKLSNVPENLGEKDVKKYEELLGQVLGIQDSLYKKIRVSLSNGLIEGYYDTFNFNQDSKPDDIAIFRNKNGGEYLVVTDPGTKSVYTISLYDKKVENLNDANKVLSKPSKVYTRSTGIFILDLESGVLRASANDVGFDPLVKLSGLSIQSIGAEKIVEFAVLTDNENAYILDRGQKTLLKSVNYEGGYSLASSYLSKDEYVKANDVFSDLSVYITAEGENGIFRYVSSMGSMVEAPIALTGLDIPIGNAKYGYTADNLNTGLYIFDETNRRVLKFEKPMESGEKRHPNELLLLNQYIFDDDSGWKSVKDIVVDYKEENLYILDGTTIWKVRL